MSDALTMEIVREDPTRTSVNWKELLSQVPQDGEWYRISMGSVKKIRAAANNLRSGNVKGMDNWDFKTQKTTESEDEARLFARYNPTAS